MTLNGLDPANLAKETLTGIEGDSAMKGQIRWFDTEAGDTLGHGGIEGVDGKQYDFDLTDWKAGTWVGFPEVGQKVVFGVNGSNARDIRLDDRVWEIVSEFPGPVTLKPSWQTRAKWVALLLVSGLFTVGGVFLGLNRDSVGWMVAAFFSLGVIFPTLRLYIPDCTLRLDKDGFEIRQNLRRQRTAWSASLLLENESASEAEKRQKVVMMVLPDSYGLDPVERLRVMTDWCREAIGYGPKGYFEKADEPVSDAIS